MRRNGFCFIGAVVAGMHLVALSFVFGPWHWKYLLVNVASGILLWGARTALTPLRRWSGLLIAAALALAVQQATFWLWRAKLGGVWWPMVQFLTLHFMIGLSFGPLRDRWRHLRQTV